MAELQTLARPYARAAFSVARDAGALADWDAALARLGAGADDERLAALIGHPDVADETLVGLLKELSGQGDLAGLANLLQLLAENGRLALLPTIAEGFAALRAAHERLQHVGIQSATPLETAQQQAIVQALKARLGLEVDVDWQVDAELIGGAVVTAGDLIIDGSVRGEIDRLRARLIQ